MKYLCLAYYDERRFEALPEADLKALVSQCPPLDAALRASGHLVVQASLGSSRASASIRPGAGKSFVTDGPFAETKEQIGGFFIIEARDKDEALRIAAMHPAAQIGGHVGWGIEVRPIDAFDLSA